MTTDDDAPRYAPGSVTPDGGFIFYWQLTPSHITDPVILQFPPEDVLPVIFVPGIMGSNLRKKSKNSKAKKAVWRLDNSRHWNWADTFKDRPLGLLMSMAMTSAAKRQNVLHPQLVEVDPGGAIPKQPCGSVHDVKQYTARGWGEVAEGSYHGFLLWLEKVLNGQGYNPAGWRQFVPASPARDTPAAEALVPGLAMATAGLPSEDDKGPLGLLSDDLIARARFRMPVYACGYNWLDSNDVAAKRLRQRILNVIKANNHKHGRCSQVVLVTHSMGGLVARACQQLSGMREAIAGIVHGVMPSVGAAVAYRRCKVGMLDEDAVSGMVVGNTGQEVTAVFAQAPGALQLLPTQQYHADWLTIESPSGKSLETEPYTGDPYKDIYLRRNRWWGLIREEWLHPPGGNGLKWEQYAKNLGIACRHDFMLN